MGAEEWVEWWNVSRSWACVGEVSDVEVRGELWRALRRCVERGEERFRLE